MGTPSGVQTLGPQQSAYVSQQLSAPTVHYSNLEGSLKIPMLAPHPQRARKRFPGYSSAQLGLGTSAASGRAAVGPHGPEFGTQVLL